MTSEPVVEHAVRMSGGDMQVRNGGAHIERIYPLAEWICGQQRFGGKVYRRTIVVVDDWAEVPRSGEQPAGATPNEPEAWGLR